MTSDGKVHAFEEVAKHNQKGDCWLIISEKVDAFLVSVRNLDLDLDLDLDMDMDMDMDVVYTHYLSE
ncbi:hypothetical protein RJ640_008885 [Escallonia rubra]|uniref:Uncharacterized protein n=1 Tax=Escallonia rubra TaxID=112253 RepID=A0AA88RRV0_9ASTE|nr:hypothetical protein RJ640_008885 [Escallonia rubra]